MPLCFVLCLTHFVNLARKGDRRFAQQEGNDRHPGTTDRKSKIFIRCSLPGLLLRNLSWSAGRVVGAWAWARASGLATILPGSFSLPFVSLPCFQIECFPRQVTTQRGDQGEEAGQLAESLSILLTGGWGHCYCILLCIVLATHDYARHNNTRTEVQVLCGRSNRRSPLNRE